MRFNPKSENEIASENLWPIGEYDFEVAAAEETTSKAGNDMIKLTLRVYNAEGQFRLIFDYLMESVAFKLRHFAEATGMLSDYENGTLEADRMVERRGRCKVAIQKDKSGQYPDRNGIADYLPAKAAPATARRPAPARQMAPAGSDLDDEIPF